MPCLNQTPMRLNYPGCRHASLAIWLVAIPAAAAAEPGAPPAPAPALFDRIWSYTEWYKNEENPVIQSFDFTGRFQLDYTLVDAHQGHHDEWNIRRFRVGGKAGLFDHVTLKGEVNLNPQEPHPFYQGLTDMYVAWSRDKAFTATVGKHSAPFTLDGSISSTKQLAVDRGNLANNLWFSNEYFPGLSLSGEPGPWRYRAGLYSSGAGNPEFGEFNGGVFALGTVGYEFAKALEVKQALLTADYVYNEPDSDNTWTRSLQHVGSLNFRFETGRWGVRSDLSGGLGYGRQSDLWGGMLMPFYNLTDHFQAVTRYTYLKSDHRDGLRLARYENLVVSGRGDEYHEIYFGLNYYIYQHQLKLQTGVQYADMSDRADNGGKYSGWAWTTGLRISW